MRIISFAYTTPALLSLKKKVTRRFWQDEYAKQFRKGQLIQAYDKNPRVGGKRVAILRLTEDPYKEQLGDMTDREEKLEGGLWGSAEAFIEAMGHPSLEVWVIRFIVVKIFK
jgi:hypothetical protein